MSMAVTIWPRRLISPSMTSGRLRHGGHVLEAQHFLNAKNIHAEKQIRHEKRGELSAALRQFGFHDCGIGRHGYPPLLRTPVRSGAARAKASRASRLEHRLPVELRLAILKPAVRAAGV